MTNACKYLLVRVKVWPNSHQFHGSDKLIKTNGVEAKSVQKGEKVKLGNPAPQQGLEDEYTKPGNRDSLSQ